MYYWYKRNNYEFLLGENLNSAIEAAKKMLEEDTRELYSFKTGMGTAFARIVSISGYVVCKLALKWSLGTLSEVVVEKETN